MKLGVTLPGGEVLEAGRRAREAEDLGASAIWMTFQDDWVAFQAKDLMNHNQLLWANDSPHTDSTWPHSQELLATHAARLTTPERGDILRDNVMRVFGFPL